jgi:hypothetical protein
MNANLENWNRREQEVMSNARSGSDSRKQAISIRMSRADVRNIKRLAERLGARDSDVIRFAIKLMLAKLAPLQDPKVGGRGLVPVFLESGADLMRHFELDAATLTSIINEGINEDRRVDPDDIQLLAMYGIQRSYVNLRLTGLRRAQGGEGSTHAHRWPGADYLAGRTRSVEEGDYGDDTLRDYLYEKYLNHDSPISPDGEGRKP